MQILTTRYNFKFHKLTFYGITRPQSIRKSKQISGKTILSSLQNTEFNPIFAKNRDIRMVKNSVTRPVTPVLPKERAVRRYRLGVCKAKKSKTPKLCQNIGLGKLFLEK